MSESDDDLAFDAAIERLKVAVNSVFRQINASGSQAELIRVAKLSSQEITLVIPLIHALRRPRYDPPTDVVDEVWSTYGAWFPTSDFTTCVNSLQSRSERRERVLLVPAANGGISGGSSFQTRTFEQACVPDLPPPDPTFFTITGNISTVGGPLAGVAFTVSAPAVCPVTDASGNYTCTVPDGWDGLITPVLQGYDFTPPWRAYTDVQANDTADDFDAETADALVDTVWFEDALPTGATAGTTGTGEAWTWVGANPAPRAGTLSHQQINLASLHAQWFWGATATMTVPVDGVLFTHIYINPAALPDYVVVRWLTSDASWAHMAYWQPAASGTEGPDRHYIGPVPAAGGWVRLEVPADSVSLEGTVVQGMQFVIGMGQATWDSTGCAAPAAAPPISGEERPMPSGADEIATYALWGWSHSGPVYTEPLPNFSVFNVDVHEDTEGDDLWTYLMMYRRTGQQLYLNRANAWLRYFKDDYLNSASYDADGQQQGLDHTYGWGLIDWYLKFGDAAALAAAKAIGRKVESYYQPDTPFGCLAVSVCMQYSLRLAGRHLLLLTRLSELDASFIGIRDRVLNFVINSPWWVEAYGSYFSDAPVATYGVGARVVSTFELGVLVEGMYQAWRVTQRDDIKVKLIAIADFVDDYGLDDVVQYSGSRFGIVGGVKWHNDPNPGGDFWDTHYTIALVNTLVYGYKLTGTVAYLDRAKFFFNRATKAIYGSKTARAAADNQVHHFIDTEWDTSDLGKTLKVNKGELQYCYQIFENGGLPSVHGASPVAPAAPTVLTVPSVGPTQVNLSFTDNANNELGFKVERKQITGVAQPSFAQIAPLLGPNVTTFNDPGRPSSSTSEYRVRAYNATGDSAYSNTVSATTSAASAIPPPPTPAPTGVVPTYLVGQAIGVWFQVPNTRPSLIASSAAVDGKNGVWGFSGFNGGWWDSLRGNSGVNAAGGHGDGWYNGGWWINWWANAPVIAETHAGSAFANVIAESGGYYGDELPASRHLYNSEWWHELYGRVVIITCANTWGATGNGSGPWLDGFHPYSGVYDLRGTLPNVPVIPKADVSICVDQLTGNIYHWWDNNLAIFNYATRTWSLNAAQRQQESGQSAIDPRRRRMVYFGSSTSGAAAHLPSWMDLSNNQFTLITAFTNTWDTKGYGVGAMIQHPTTPALDWFPIRHTLDAGGEIIRVNASTYVKDTFPTTGGGSIPASDGYRYSKFGVLTNINGTGIDIAVDASKYNEDAWVCRLQ